MGVPLDFSPPHCRNGFDFLQFHESHPPLFYVLMRLWGVAFGFRDSVLLVFMGVIIAMVVLALYMPLFDLSSVVGG